MSTENSSLEAVWEYYGKTLRSSADLTTGACCCAEAIPVSHAAILGQIDEEITNRFYGCGSPIPPALEGCTVLDLGCGAGRDAYLASQLVGPTGRVIGVDATKDQIDIAERHRESQARRFGMERPNTEFRLGTIEDLAALGIENGSVDVGISNCAINLAEDKRRVLAEILRVLRPGGELYFSDVFAGRRVPKALRDDPVLMGECMAGAMYIEDFRRLMLELGCADLRVVSKRRIAIGNVDAERRVGGIDFYSMTVRVFKLEGLEDRCEDYGQVGYYLGTIPEHPWSFALDDHHTFVTGKALLVCGNTAAMVSETRYGRHFRVVGDRSLHYGLFDCGVAESAGAEGCEGSGCGCGD